jgi:hypothetical protein
MTAAAHHRDLALGYAPTNSKSVNVHQDCCYRQVSVPQPIYLQIDTEPVGLYISMVTLLAVRSWLLMSVPR